MSVSVSNEQRNQFIGIKSSKQERESRQFRTSWLTSPCKSVDLNSNRLELPITICHLSLPLLSCHTLANTNPFVKKQLMPLFGHLEVKLSKKILRKENKFRNYNEFRKIWQVSESKKNFKRKKKNLRRNCIKHCLS